MGVCGFLVDAGMRAGERLDKPDAGFIGGSVTKFRWRNVRQSLDFIVDASTISAG